MEAGYFIKNILFWLKVLEMQSLGTSFGDGLLAGRVRNKTQGTQRERERERERERGEREREREAFLPLLIKLPDLIIGLHPGDFI
jgi:hypothetical protein